MSIVRDGFQEIFSFKSHNSKLKGIIKASLGDELLNNERDNFVTWDDKSLQQWDFDSDRNDTVVNFKFKYPNHQQNFITCVIFYERLKVFICSSLDNSFKIFDKNFKLLQTIPHNERAILSLQYDEKYFDKESDNTDADEVVENIGTNNNSIDNNNALPSETTSNIKNVIYTYGCLISCGTAGLILWKLEHSLNIKRRQNEGNTSTYDITKFHIFDKYTQWISNMTYDSASNRIYIFMDRSVHVLNLKLKRVVCILNDIHETPTTAAMWYARSTFYLTACSGGDIKCWTSNFSANTQSKSAAATESVTEQSGNRRTSMIETMKLKVVKSDAEKLAEKVAALSKFEREREQQEFEDACKFAVLHEFKFHSKPVTGLVLHSVENLIMSASLDGYIKIVDLERFSLVREIEIGAPVLIFRTLLYRGTLSCLFSIKDSTVKLWKINTSFQPLASASDHIHMFGYYKRLVEKTHFTIIQEAKKVSKRAALLSLPFFSEFAIKSDAAASSKKSVKSNTSATKSSKTRGSSRSMSRSGYSSRSSSANSRSSSNSSKSSKQSRRSSFRSSNGSSRSSKTSVSSYDGTTLDSESSGTDSSSGSGSGSDTDSDSETEGQHMTVSLKSPYETTATVTAAAVGSSTESNKIKNPQSPAAASSKGYQPETIPQLIADSHSLLVTVSEQECQIHTETGHTINSLDANEESPLEDIIAIQLNVEHSLLYCLYDHNIIKCYDIEVQSCPLIGVLNICNEVRELPEISPRQLKNLQTHTFVLIEYSDPIHLPHAHRASSTDRSRHSSHQSSHHTSNVKHFDGEDDETCVSCLAAGTNLGFIFIFEIYVAYDNEAYTNSILDSNIANNMANRKSNKSITYNMFKNKISVFENKVEINRNEVIKKSHAMDCHELSPLYQSVGISSELGGVYEINLSGKGNNEYNSRANSMILSFGKYENYNKGGDSIKSSTLSSRSGKLLNELTPEEDIASLKYNCRTKILTIWYKFLSRKKKSLFHHYYENNQDKHKMSTTVNMTAREGVSTAVANESLVSEATPASTVSATKQEVLCESDDSSDDDDDHPKITSVIQIWSIEALTEMLFATRKNHKKNHHNSEGHHNNTTHHSTHHSDHHHHHHHHHKSSSNSSQHGHDHHHNSHHTHEDHKSVSGGQINELFKVSEVFLNSANTHGGITCLTSSLMSNYLAVGCREGDLKLFKFHNHNHHNHNHHNHNHHRHHRHSHHSHHVNTSASSATIHTETDNSTITVTSKRPKKCREIISNTLGHEGPVLSIDFAIQQAIFATAGLMDHKVKIWTYERKILCHILLHDVSQSIYFHVRHPETESTTPNNSNSQDKNVASNVDNQHDASKHKYDKISTDTKDTECLIISHKSNIMLIESSVYMPKNSFYPFHKNNANKTIHASASMISNRSNSIDPVSGHMYDDDDDDNPTHTELSKEELKFLEAIEEKTRLRKRYEKMIKKQEKEAKEKERLYLLRKQKLIPDTFINFVKKYLSTKRLELELKDLELAEKKKIDKTCLCNTSTLTQEEILKYKLYSTYYDDNTYNTDKDEIRAPSIVESIDENIDADDRNTIQQQNINHIYPRKPRMTHSISNMSPSRYFALSKGVSPRVRLGVLKEIVSVDAGPDTSETEYTTMHQDIDNKLSTKSTHVKKKATSSSPSPAELTNNFCYDLQEIVRRRTEESSNKKLSLKSSIQNKVLLLNPNRAMSANKTNSTFSSFPNVGFQQQHSYATNNNNNNNNESKLTGIHSKTNSTITGNIETLNKKMSPRGKHQFYAKKPLFVISTKLHTNDKCEDSNAATLKKQEEIDRIRYKNRKEVTSMPYTVLGDKI